MDFHLPDWPARRLVVEAAIAWGYRHLDEEPIDPYTSPWPKIALIYGTDGVGKSSWASHAPNPIFIGAEKGTEQLDVARFPQTESIGELMAQVRALQTEKPDFEARGCFRTADRFETRFHTQPPV